METHEDGLEPSIDGIMATREPDAIIRRTEIYDKSSPSKPTTVLGLPLNLYLGEMYSWDRGKHALIYLSTRDGKVSHDYELKVAVKFVLIHPEDGPNVAKQRVCNFSSNMTNPCGWNSNKVEIVPLEELEGFVDYRDQFIRIEARLWVLESRGLRKVEVWDFTGPSSFSDVVFKIGDERVHANKTYLSMASPVFRAMIQGHFTESTMDEIELKETDHKEFIVFLSAIYPSPKQINEDNVETLLAYADQYDVPSLTSRVEEFLMETKWLNIAKKLHLSDRFGLLSLQTMLMETFDEPYSIKAVMNQDESDDFSDKLKATLFHELLNIM